MAQSQNGWTVVGESACDQGPFNGVVYPNGILKGDVAVIARWQMARYSATVEPIVAGTCWGWFVKRITGSEDYSNHSSGTAWDINAPQHPMGTPASHNMSSGEIAACHAIEADSQGTLRWGGDFGRPDPMHWEIDGSRSEVAAFAAWIRGEDDDLVTTQAQFNTFMDNWWNDRMAPDASPSRALVNLRVAPWDQLVGRSGVTTHNTLFGPMAGDLAQTRAELADVKSELAEIKTLLAAQSGGGAVVAPKQIPS
jgi:hypothetical protein